MMARRRRLARFTAFGDEADLKIRAAKLDEGLAIIEGLFTARPFSFQGEHYQLDNVEFLPGPLQQPRLPIWLASTWPVRAPFAGPLASREPGRCAVRQTARAIL
jgi:alkanesulfonate monooxygenase SsuD/methylene tetrahydromethanopterin reductase-like flavin-dependent oxidoreductase (luciferase family)